MSAYSLKNSGAAIVCVLTVLLATPIAASAIGLWGQNHPRRAEMNARLVNQNRRIYQDRREGEIKEAQAFQLHQQERQIRREERLMARQHGGHLTRQEQGMLSRQENQLSREIGR